jgi:hypothetical protein
VEGELSEGTPEHLDTLPHKGDSPQFLRNFGPELQVIYHDQTLGRVVLMHRAHGMRTHLRHREPAAAGHECKPMGHRLPCRGSLTQLLEVCLTPLDIPQIDPSFGAQGFQHKVRRGVLKRHKHHRYICAHMGGDLQGQRGFPHTRWATEQMQADIQAI